MSSSAAESQIARAKVNLSLRVLGRRADGYHALESLVTFADVGDVVRLDPGGPTGQLSTSGLFATAIDGENLLSRVVASVAALAPALKLGSVHLEKNLPVAAGLGGGSADAAALMRLIRNLNRGHPDLAAIDWMALAAKLGADVPVCLAQAPTLMWGVGERLLPLPLSPAMQAMPAVLVNPRQPLATRDVFQALAASPLADEPASPLTPRLATLDDVAAFMRTFGNDLERPAQAVLPVITDMKAALAAQSGCLHAALSGSGPTCFALYRSAGEAQAAGSALARAKPGWWIAPTTLAFPG
jgi:4-diphosphocytidyl-2-C-methyl-D-erythritol kinase